MLTVEAGDGWGEGGETTVPLGGVGRAAAEMNTCTHFIFGLNNSNGLLLSL